MRYKINLLLILIFCFLLTGCNEKTCSYCGEKKQCKEYDVLGTKRLVCMDCIKNPTSMSSNSVINEYKAEELDPSLFPSEDENHSTLIEETPVNDNNSSNNDSSEIAPAPSDINSSSDNLSNDDLTSDANSSNNGKTESEIVNVLAASLASYSIQIAPDSSEKGLYNIYSSNGSDAAIDFIFTTNGNNTKLTINEYSGSGNYDFTNSCICSILAFIGSSDYDGQGVEIFNNTCDYGNYSSNGCSFYYTTSSPDEISAGKPMAVFEITIQ